VTEPPHDHERSPSVAALAVQVYELRRDLKSLKAKLDAVVRTQHEQAAVPNDLAELRQQVEKILDLVTEDDESSHPWFWLTMPEREREEKLRELTDWVETVLRVQYPDYLADQIRLCCPSHPEARWELAWLYQLWSATYLGTRSGVKDAADRHDRWSPGVFRRLSHVMAQCERACRSAAEWQLAATAPVPPITSACWLDRIGPPVEHRSCCDGRRGGSLEILIAVLHKLKVRGLALCRRIIPPWGFLPRIAGRQFRVAFHDRMSEMSAPPPCPRRF